jgi:hypothetical protein
VARYPGLWSFHSGPVQHLSNQYAAMPSLHFAWAAWVAWAVWPVVRTSFARVAVVAYPAATFVVVVVTANHFFADVAAGALTLAAAVAMVNGTQAGVAAVRARATVTS